MDTPHEKIKTEVKEETKNENHSPDNNEGANKKIMAVLAYLGILLIIPLVFSKKNPFVNFHVRQGLVLLSISLIIWLLGYLSLPIWFLYRIVNLGVIILSIIGIINVIKNKREGLPFVGQFAKHFKV